MKGRAAHRPAIARTLHADLARRLVITHELLLQRVELLEVLDLRPLRLAIIVLPKPLISVLERTL